MFSNPQGVSMSKTYFSILTCVLFFLQTSVHCQIINVATQEDFGNLMRDKNVVVIKFYTTWCGACNAIEETFKELSEMPSMKNAIFAQVDIDALPSIGKKYNIATIPQIISFQNDRNLVYKHSFDSFDTFKKMLEEQINAILKGELDIIPATPLKTSNPIERIVTYLMIPINFVIQCIEWLWKMIQSLL